MVSGQNTTARADPWPLTSRGYRSYQQVIQIYHYRAKYFSAADLREVLKNSYNGYVETLIGTDTLEGNHFVLDGDVIPRGSIEAAYLPAVFPDNRNSRHASPGSALGFRAGLTIEWLCFDRPIDDILSTWFWKKSTNRIQVKLNIHPDHKRKLFNCVATMDKGLVERRVRGAHTEHVQWFTSLLGAKHRPLRVRMTWRNFGTQLKKQHAADRAEAKRRRKEEEDDSDEDDSDIDLSKLKELQEEFRPKFPTGPLKTTISLNAGGIVHASSTPTIADDTDSQDDMDRTPSKPPRARLR